MQSLASDLKIYKVLSFWKILLNNFDRSHSNHLFCVRPRERITCTYIVLSVLMRFVRYDIRECVGVYLMYRIDDEIIIFSEQDSTSTSLLLLIYCMYGLRS